MALAARLLPAMFPILQHLHFEHYEVSSSAQCSQSFRAWIPL